MLATAALAGTLATAGSDARHAFASKPAEVPPEVLKVGHAVSQPGINPGEVSGECSQLSAADAQRLTGVPMKRIEGPPLGIGKLITAGCFYVEVSPRPGAQSSVALSVGWTPKKETAKSSFDFFKGLAPKEKTDSKGLAGVGEDAYWVHGSVGALFSPMLQARKNSYSVRLNVALVKTEPLGAMKEIVGRILKNL
jgi:hypothetical protein